MWCRSRRKDTLKMPDQATAPVSMPDEFPVLIVHNRYRQKGGEDSVVEDESALLESRGHRVKVYTRHNDEIEALGRVSAAIQTLWSSRTCEDMEALISDFRPKIIHVHNTFPLVSPSIYYAAARFRVPVVQTLHNFRLICPQAMLLREGRVCEDCVGRFPWRGVAHACYRESVAQSGVLVGMLALHRGIGTYHRHVSRYIALNKFCRQKFIQGGLPAEKILVKPNFVNVPQTENAERNGGLFVGRLAPEKGIQVLVDAMSKLADVNLHVIGSGPQDAALDGCPQLHRLGFLSRGEILERMRRAAYLVMPSIWYETFGLVAVEAFASGLPVIASRLGAMAELVDDGETGLLFEPGSATDLAAKIAWAEDHPEEMRRMGRNARRRYEAEFTAEANYAQLMSIYRDAIATG